LKKLLGGQVSGNLSRQAVVERYRKEISALTQSGRSHSRPERGQEIFTTHCARCHVFHGRGHAVGPDISAAGKKPPVEILVALLDPNRTVEPGYTVFFIKDRRGLLLSGILAAETATAITLRQAEAVEQTLARENIQLIQATPSSLMPENLEEVLSPADVADLIAYLKEAVER
jgi:putative heme-binding domain-containing protein